MPASPPGFAVDLHVHTGRYSQCAEFVNPFELAPRALEAGLAGLVLTEHDIFWQDEEIELLRAASHGVTIYRGIEVSAKGCHLVVIGIDDAGPLMRGSRVEEVVEYAAGQRAAVILAHPFRDADPAAVPVELLDAVEVGSTSFTGDEAAAAQRLAARFAKPTVAASDAHALSRLGWAFTAFPTLPANERELAEAIRDGIGSPVIPSPFPGSP